MKRRSYSDLMHLTTLEERYNYLALGGQVGTATFGFERFLNQRFYRSSEWRSIRNFVIHRDSGCDLGAAGYEINDRVLIHHMNPMREVDLTDFNPEVLDPEFLITTTLRTHNAIHFGTEAQLVKPFVERTPGDTKLW